MAEQPGGKYIKRFPKPGGGYTYVYQHDPKTHGGTAEGYHRNKMEYHTGIGAYHQKNKDNDQALHHYQVALEHKRAARSSQRVSTGGGGLFGKPAGATPQRKETGTGIFGQKEKMSDLLGPKKPARDDILVGREQAIQHIRDQALNNPHLRSFLDDPRKWDKKDVVAQLDKLEGDTAMSARSAYRALTNWQVQNAIKTLGVDKGGFFVDLVKAWRGC